MDKNLYNAFNWEKSSPVFPWVKDMTLNGGSGAWRPATTADLGGAGGYQDTPFHDTLSISGASVQITSNTNKGWMTLSVDASNSAAQAWIGASGVVSGNGFLLNSSMPTTTISSDDLSEWYAYGPSGSSNDLYILGAYIQ